IDFKNPKGLTLAAGYKVNMTVDASGGYDFANIDDIRSTDPLEPDDEGTVYDAAHPVAGDLKVTSGTVTLSGTNVSGNITVNAAKIIIKSHNGMKTTVGKGLKAQNGAQIVFYNSVIQGTAVVNNSQSLSALNGNMNSTVVANNNTSSVSINGVTIDDSLVATNNASVSVTNCNINGDLILQHNTTCSSPPGSNTVAYENNGCQP
ncbi:MAG: hypothetical protein HY063_06440, partial [Bacteroidetes bacterium]|nr:hypothetical protein [Bacteroidota bacterium]